MQTQDFKRIKKLRSLTGFPEFWIAARYWELIDNNPDKTDEELSEILKEIEMNSKINEYSPSETGMKYASNCANGIASGINKKIPHIERVIEEQLKQMEDGIDFQPFEFVGRIDGPPLTQYRKR